MSLLDAEDLVPVAVAGVLKCAVIAWPELTFIIRLQVCKQGMT